MTNIVLIVFLFVAFLFTGTVYLIISHHWSTWWLILPILYLFSVSINKDKNNGKV